MLGHTLLKYLTNKSNYDVYCTLRAKNNKLTELFKSTEKFYVGFSAKYIEKFDSLFKSLRPDFVINCIGVIKQVDSSKNVTKILPINSIFPHQIAELCEIYNIRFIHVSTDCVFNGEKGSYKENDVPDAKDLYGISKFLGETYNYYPDSLTIRTSIIGPELNTKNSLLGWFLAQEKKVLGYKNAIFSGLTTIELSRVIHKYLLCRNDLKGLYHISSNPINKYDLLKLLAFYYEKEIDINVDESIVIDRSLDSNKFKKVTGYIPPNWHVLLEEMSLKLKNA